MKNKSKLKKIKEKNMAPVAKLPQGWMLMMREEMDVVELAERLPKDYDIQVWKEAQVMEIVLGEKSSIDVEAIECPLGDEYSDAYIESEGIKCIFYLSFRPDAYELAKPVLKLLSDAVDGFVCGDTEDFSPKI